MHRWGSKLVVGTGLAVMAAGFLMASRLEADTPYVGLTVASMVTMAIGLGLATGPATESIMGALPEARAGVGSAVNDTTRELGGTLGVAVVGSVFASVYGSTIADGLAAAGAPEQAVSVARESLAGALAVAQELPGSLAAEVVSAAQTSFVDGLAAGSLVAAGVAAFGALIAFAFLPARAAEQPGEPTTAGDVAQSRMRHDPVSTATAPLTDPSAA
jgi:hypothetical protein